MSRIHPSEHDEQAALFRWAGLWQHRLRALALLHAIPNGGHRNKIVAARLKAEGVRRGVPDICLPVARGGYHGLYVELKAKGGALSPEQRQWIADLRAQGYRAEACVGWQVARAVIEDYLCVGAEAGRPRALTTVPAQGAEA